MVLQKKIIQVIRSKDQTYCYTLNPSPIHPKSNKIEHHLKITDYFIALKHRSNFVIESKLGSYTPDIFYKDQNNVSFCIEIQLTKISTKKMQEKVDSFITEYGKEHDSLTMVIVSHTTYPKIKLKNGFHVVYQNVPPEIVL
jgi:hypothetical protein